MVDIAGTEEFDPDEVAVGHRPVAEPEHIPHRADGVEKRVTDGVGVRRQGKPIVGRRPHDFVGHTWPYPVGEL